ncbi:MAG: class I SAM-dependent methyltransferase [Lachnospiraceae bacterium]|nr:class I SAM-dependent methyltransferase [Lachnospiraceae bacterium]
MHISQRLSSVAALITPGLSVADIGCDHAYLAIHLIENLISPRVIAMDINKGPLKRAEEHVIEAGLNGKIELRLSDGLLKLKPGEAECIVMAGMGGPLMTGIMDAAPAVCADAAEFILQPQSEIRDVRHYLEDNGYRIVSEDLVYEEGKFYPMMKAVHGNNEPGKRERSTLYSRDIYEWIEAINEEPELLKLRLEAFYSYGGLLLKEKHPILRDYLKYENELRNEIRNKLFDSVRTDKVSDRLDEIAYDIEVLTQGTMLLNY